MNSSIREINNVVQEDPSNLVECRPKDRRPSKNIDDSKSMMASMMNIKQRPRDAMIMRHSLPKRCDHSIDDMDGPPSLNPIVNQVLCKGYFFGVKQ
jgi:hypothetical protein